jgi:ABC-type Mn2+/Zn2+ transport system permease subunit
MINPFSLSLITGVFIGGVAGYLGSLMVSKRMGLVAGPLGHLTLPGIALALLYNFDVSLGALPFVVLGAILIWFLEIKTHLPAESLTAVVFATGVAIAFLLLPSETLETALIGDIAQVGFWGAIASLIASLVLFLILRKIYTKVIFSSISKDLAKVEGIDVRKYNFIYLTCIAIVVALGVKMVGGLLTAALVAIPACVSRNLSKNLLQYSYGAMMIGSLSCVLGILFYKFTGFPAGPLIILTSSFFFLISIIFKR